MKHILLSIVVISALVVAGVGGTFAHFSDTEESVDNLLQVGSMDLKIKKGDVYVDDPNVAIVISVLDIQPEDSEDRTITVKNVGQPEGDICELYIHVKNPRCSNVDNKDGSARPEPEVVAEDGGALGQMTIPGIGLTGDTCNLGDFVTVVITYKTVEKYNGTLAGLICNQQLIGYLNKCDPEEAINFRFVIPDISEDYFVTNGLIAGGTAAAPDYTSCDNDGDWDVNTDDVGHDGTANTGDAGEGDGKPTYGEPNVDEDGATGDDPIGWFGGDNPMCWDKWPTNALMKDKILFDILFSLVQVTS